MLLRAGSKADRALDEPFSAFPSWFLRITCDRCGKDRMVNEVHMPQRDLPLRDILDRMRHDGCGGRAGRVELLTGIEGASRRPGAQDHADRGRIGSCLCCLLNNPGRAG